jgi:hypothetical protein
MGRNIELTIGKTTGWQSGERIPKVTFSALFQNGPKNHSASSKIYIGILQRQNGRNVLLTTQNLSPLRIKKE